MTVSYMIQPLEACGHILGAFKKFNNGFIPSPIFKISIKIPREGEELYLDFKIGEESNFNPEENNLEIILEANPYLTEDGSWEENGYDDFCADMISLCMASGWKLLLAPDAPADLQRFA